MTKEELEVLRCANLLEDNIKNITEIEEAYFSQCYTMFLEVSLYEKGYHKRNIRINRDAFHCIIDALKKIQVRITTTI